MAILAGTNTIMDDDPQLNVRDWTGKNPTRIILDRNNRIPENYYVKNQKIKSIILTEKANLTNLENFLFEKVEFDNNLPFTIMEVLYHKNLQSVIIEGGTQTIQMFINTGLWDEARVFKGQALFNEGIKAPVLHATAAERHTITDDELLIFRNHGKYNNI